MHRYASSSKQSTFRSDYALSDAQLAHYAPSVMASEAHSGTSSHYSFVPTLRVIDGLRAEGFQPYEVRQTNVRDQSKREFTKHMVRIRHSGNIVGDVIEGATRVLENTALIADRINTYKSITLEQPETAALATAAMQLRWGDESPVRAVSLLQAHRWEDKKPDLWTTFNRIQENVLKGGVQGRSSTGRRTTTREVGGVSENVKLNKALWTLMDAMAKMKMDRAEDEFIGQYDHAYN